MTTQRPWQRRIARIALALLVSLCPWHRLVGGEDVTAEEYHIKAAFLYNFGKFAEWPKSAFSSTDQPFVLGVVGKDPFGRVLEELTEGKSLAGHRLVVRRFDTPEAIGDCHLLFVSSSLAEDYDAVLKKVAGKPTLTVGDTPEFARKGGIVGFYVEERKVRFEINVDASRRASIVLSSKLLKVGKILDERAERS